MKAFEVKEGAVFFKTKRMKDKFHCPDMRRVIAVVDNWVFYSDGSNKNNACTVDAMEEWLVDANEFQREPV